MIPISTVDDDDDDDDEEEEEDASNVVIDRKKSKIKLSKLPFHLQASEPTRSSINISYGKL